MINYFIKIFLTIIICCNLALAKNQNTQFNIKNSFKAKVIHISDGDTISVISQIPCNNNSYKNNNKFKCTNGLSQYKIRLFGIDTPEMGQSFGEEAKKILSDLIFNKTILIKPIDIDIYKRLVANIYLNDIWINAKMIETGSAWVYRKYVNDYDLIKIEQQARNKKIGIWSLPKSQQIPPWQWRKQNKNYHNKYRKNKFKQDFDNLFFNIYN